MSKWDLQSWINVMYFFGKAPLPTKVALILLYACMSTQVDRQKDRHPDATHICTKTPVRSSLYKL